MKSVPLIYCIVYTCLISLCTFRYSADSGMLNKTHWFRKLVSGFLHTQPKPKLQPGITQGPDPWTLLT